MPEHTYAHTRSGQVQGRKTKRVKNNKKKSSLWHAEGLIPFLRMAYVFTDFCKYVNVLKYSFLDTLYDINV